ncbi:VanZ family protein [Namhaeicola litoreus]|uniref:VanZ family protein n=1 Tax=Namhaeicola litoreus TaxID=1052145 RepID=A0ABW3XZS1_9FLAO
MLQHIKKLLEHNALYIAIAITTFIAYLSLSSESKIDLGFTFKSKDKLYHTLAYFTLTFAWLFAFRNKYQNNKFKILTLCALTFYGIILEVLQGTLTNYRTSDLYDAIANFLGVILGIFAFNIFLKWYNQ